MECWNIGEEVADVLVHVVHYSDTSIFQYSIIPTFR
jgi:hypothetical protein